MTAAAIAAGDQHTATAGAEVLRAGGNAVDAICAASCMAFVAEAPLCGPGGGGVLLTGDADELAVLDFFSAVPGLGRDPAQHLDFRHVDVDFGPTTQRFHIGRGSVAVPGTLLGLLVAHERYGTMPWSELVQPAVRAARQGVTPSDQLNFVTRLLRPILQLSPSTTRLFYDDDGNPHFANEALADLLTTLADEGRSLVMGALGEQLIAEFGASAGGLLTRADLDDYAPIWRTPLSTTVGDATVFTNPPPSSGGALVSLGLQLAGQDAELPETWLGPRHMGQLAVLLAAMDDAKSTPLDTIGLVEQTQRFAELQRIRRNLGSTTHISVLDRRGQLASLTMSNGEGCGYTLSRGGVHLNNFLGEQDINPGGFHQQPAGTRMTTMMAPTAVVRGGRVALVLGTGGSNRIRSALLLTLLYRLQSGRSLGDTIAAPRMHVEAEQLWYERAGLPAATESALREAWPEAIAFDAPNMFFGGVHAIATEPEVHGVGDHRRGGTVIRV